MTTGNQTRSLIEFTRLLEASPDEAVLIAATVCDTKFATLPGARQAVDRELRRRGLTDAFAALSAAAKDEANRMLAEAVTMHGPDGSELTLLPNGGYVRISPVRKGDRS